MKRIYETKTILTRKKNITLMKWRKSYTSSNEEKALDRNTKVEGISCFQTKPNTCSITGSDFHERNFF